MKAQFLGVHLAKHPREERRMEEGCRKMWASMRSAGNSIKLITEIKLWINRN